MANIKWGITEKVESAIILSLIAIGLSFNFEIVYCYIKEDVFDNASDSAILITYFSVITAALVAMIFKIGSKTDKLQKALEDTKINNNPELFYKGTIGIYKDVEQEIALLSASKKKIEIDILGFTLFSVKDKFYSWKTNNLSKMTVNLFYIDPRFVKSSPHVNSRWETHINLYLSEIKKFVNDEAAYLNRKKISINFYPVSYIPHVHGFRLHNNSIYISFSMWDDNNLLYNPSDQSTYIKIQDGDTSANARYFRNIFDNWVKKGKSRSLYRDQSQ